MCSFWDEPSGCTSPAVARIAHGDCDILHASAAGDLQRHVKTLLLAYSRLLQSVQSMSCGLNGPQQEVELSLNEEAKIVSNMAQA